MDLRRGLSRQNGPISMKSASAALPPARSGAVQARAVFRPGKSMVPAK